MPFNISALSLTWNSVRKHPYFEPLYILRFLGLLRMPLCKYICNIMSSLCCCGCYCITQVPSQSLDSNKWYSIYVKVLHVSWRFHRCLHRHTHLMIIIMLRVYVCIYKRMFVCVDKCLFRVHRHMRTTKTFANWTKYLKCLNNCFRLQRKKKKKKV